MRRGRGFTLIEALVALSIFSFIGIAAYQLLASTGRIQEGGEQRFHALSGVQAAVRMLDEDFTQFIPRPVPRERGEPQPALDAAPEDAVVELTRGGWRNPLGAPRSGLQRVAWALDEDGNLTRRFRREIDDPDPQKRVERVVATGIEKFTLRFLDDKGKWLERWPPEVRAQPAPPVPPGTPPAVPVPRAVEVTLVHKQIGEVVRVIPLD